MVEEQTHTFIFADMAGFTALTDAHGDEQAAAMAGEFFGLVRGLLATYRGEEIKTIGDAVMLRCDAPEDAVRLGLEIIAHTRARPQFPIVHVGIHTGPAIERGGDWFGAAVNLAARVCGLAAGGEVLLTGSTRQATGELAGVEFRRHGAQRLRNVKRAVEIYRAASAGEADGGLPVDPVCRMAVDPGRGVGSLVYQGVEHHFCSLECAQAFAAAPEDYASPDAD